MVRIDTNDICEIPAQTDKLVFFNWLKVSSFRAILKYFPQNEKTFKTTHLSMLYIPEILEDATCI